MSKRRDPAIRRHNDKIIAKFVSDNGIEKTEFNNGLQVRLVAPTATVDIFPTSGAYNVIRTDYVRFIHGLTERNGERGHANLNNFLPYLFFAGGDL